MLHNWEEYERINGKTEQFLVFIGSAPTGMQFGS